MLKTQEGIVSDTSRLRKVGNSLSLIVPKGIRAALNWGEGELLLLRADQNRIVVVPVRPEQFPGMDTNDNSLDTEN